MGVKATSAMARSSLVAFLLLVGLLAWLLRGQTVADTMQRWGLPGTWAVDCDQPLSDTAPRTRYVTRQDGGAVMERLYTDPSRSAAGMVTGATIATDGTITLTIDVPASKQARIVSLLKSGNRIRALFDRVAGTDDYSIRDGRFTHSGIETPWQNRCDG